MQPMTYNVPFRTSHFGDGMEANIPSQASGNSD